MPRDVHIDSLVEGDNVLGETPSNRAVVHAAEQIRHEGQVLPLLIYEADGRWVVHDDTLRLRAFKRLRDKGRWPENLKHLYVFVVVLSGAEAAAFHGCDDVIGKQLGPVDEAIYLKRLLEVYMRAGAKELGGRVRRDNRSQPANQQPGATGFLRARYGWSDEWARQSAHRTRLSWSLLFTLREEKNVTKGALTRAGKAIYHDPASDPDAVARSALNGGCTKHTGSKTPDAESDPAAATSGSDNAVRTEPTGDPETGVAATPASQTAAHASTSSRAWQEFGRQIAHRLGSWSLDAALACLATLFAELAASAGPEASAVWSKLLATCREIEAGRGQEPATDPSTPEPASTDTPSGNTTQTRAAAAPPQAPTRETASARKPDDEPVETAQPVAQPARTDTRTKASPTNGATHGGSNARSDQTDRDNPSRGQPNNGPSGGRCTEAEAQEARHYLERLWSQLGSLANIHAASSVGKGCLDRLWKEGRLSRKNLRLLRSAAAEHGVA
ncbi:hypothetical protein CKO28_22565 [Rhodovibrio sodomensis]|uniref:Uncharacterized protein n=1 Tax=Rhodovibrio sodomensis TaxID=1088 RepID=A0ABS1DM48_9PROT|nr:hypothetical protein [Rhodovibrio sodomensis]MBK1670804.1 hypothetical protein [Rhodovibrio sodomensis]